MVSVAILKSCKYRKKERKCLFIRILNNKDVTYLKDVNAVLVSIRNGSSINTIF